MDRAKLVRFIRQLASSVEEMSEADFEAFFADLRSGGMAERKDVSRRSTAAGKLDPAELDQMLAGLRSANSREAALAYLNTLRLTRRELTAVAKWSQVHVTKEDTVANIETKLVESVVGARLNSLAIRGDGFPHRETLK